MTTEHRGSLSPEPTPDLGQWSPEAELAHWWHRLFEPNRGLARGHQRDLAGQLEPGWQERALCAQADPEAWFPPRGHGATDQVLATCAACPVRRACLAAALLRTEDGVWAGTSSEDRRLLYQVLKTGASVAEVLDHTLTDQADPDPVQGAA
jgi:WhiB family redox-sensing transcriptional regulator